MKGLLQSKIFRKNLKKWLCMYVGALLLLTTVITYSKYISKFNVEDNARSTKFDVVVDYIQNKECQGDENCKYTCDGEVDNRQCSLIETHRPTTITTYDFQVGYELEVNTLLAITLHPEANFEILKLVEVNDNTEKVLFEKGTTPIVAEGVGVGLDGIITVTNNIKAPAFNKADSKKYRVEIKYNYKDEEFSELVGENENIKVPVFHVDYSAKQEK